jgi:fructokinase
MAALLGEVPITARGLVIGEAFVDLIAQTDEHGTVYVPRFGGSALNVAVGLRRLGTPVQLAATLTPGVFGTALQDFCAREGVDIKSLSTPVDQTFLAVATPHDGHVNYEYFGDLSSLTAIERIDERTVASAAIIHASSTALLADPASSTVRRAFDNATGVRTIDPNPRPSLINDRRTYLDGLTSLYDLASLLKASDEDLAFLVPGESAESAAITIHQKHQITVVVTRAGSPTLLAHDGKLTFIDVPPTTVIDATGAGDSFMASLLADISQYGEPATTEAWTTYVRRANSAAAATCQGTGGAESMPTTASLSRGNPYRGT